MGPVCVTFCVCVCHILEQDGPCAGQTVPHVHIHILPSKQGDFAKNDEVYDAIDASAQSLPK